MVFYQQALWLMVVGLFLLLDFGKRTDRHFIGQTGWEVATNVCLVTVLGIFLALLLGVLGAGLEKLLEKVDGQQRLSHGVFWFLLYTVNLWSLKLGATVWFQAQSESFRWALVGLSLALGGILSVGLVWRFPPPYLFFQEQGKTMVGGSLVVGLLCVLLSGPGRGPEVVAQGANPNILLVTFDGLAAQHMSVYGYERETTPHLRQLAEESVVFDNFMANSNSTQFALPCFLGYYSTPQGPTGPNLAQVLAANGYPNRYFIGFWPPELFQLGGFQRSLAVRSFMDTTFYRQLRRLYRDEEMIWLASLGSEEWSYFNPYSAAYHDDIFYTYEHHPPEISFERALEYLQQHPSGSFVWCHVWKPHYPFLPKPEFADLFGSVPPPGPPFMNRPYGGDRAEYVEETMRTWYDRNVRSTDADFGEFLAEFQRLGLDDKTVLIVSADHGDSFGRGYIGHHGWTLLQSIVHVPLLLHIPGQAPVRVETLAEQLDLAPTVLALLGLEKPPQMVGESLLPYLSDPTRQSEKLRVSVSHRASTQGQGQIALFWRGHKLVYLAEDRSQFRLYNLLEDPEAREDISEEEPELVKTLLDTVKFNSD